jgi:hypothetical protein
LPLAFVVAVRGRCERRKPPPASRTRIASQTIHRCEGAGAAGTSAAGGDGADLSCRVGNFESDSMERLSHYPGFGAKLRLPKERQRAMPFGIV